MKPIDRTSLAKSIIDRFEVLISEGTLKPGEKLPPEIKLAQELSVSRHALRESLRALELVGVIKKKSGDGTYISEDIASESVKFMFLMRKNETGELFEVRKALETGLASIAAEKTQDEDFKKMRAALNDMKKFLHSSRKKFSERDIDFHMAIIKATHNEILKGLLTPLTDILEQGRLKRFHTPEVLAKSIEQHEEILKAIKKRDSILASKMMLKHLTYIEQFIV